MTSLLERWPLASAVPDRPRTGRVRPYRPDIEGLRAVAVLSVVLYHAGLGIRGGFVGVDVFFVISGFLITRQITTAVGRDGARALPRFYARRIKRLLPASAVVVVATLLAARIWAPALQVRTITVDAITTTFYGLNYRLAITGTQYLHAGDAVSPLQHFWSLAVEEQFYVVWPVLVLLCAVLGRGRRLALFAVSLLAIIGVSYWLSIVVTRSSAPWGYFSLQTRAWELALGALVSISAPRLALVSRRLAAPVAWLGLAMLVGSAFLFTGEMAYPGSAAAVPVVGTALVIAAGCGGRLGVEKLLAEPFLQSVGRISYSWYLWHWPMLIIAPMALGHPLTWPQRSAVVLVSAAVAIASYFAIENPVRGWTWPTGAWLSGGVVSSCCVAAAGLLVLGHLPSLTGTGRAVTLTASGRSALVAGLAVTAVPSNLDPALAVAATDLPAGYHSNCHADFTVTAQGSCVFGDTTATRTLVLFGDSHMEQWLPAFAAEASLRHWRIVSWTKSGCPPADVTVTNSVLKRTYTECDQWRRATLARIAALHPAAVVMSESEDVADGQVSDTAWTAATVRTLQRLQSGGAHVTYLADTPFPASDIPTCVAQHLADARACTFSTSRQYTHPARHRAITAAVTAAGIATVDPQSWICAPGGCPVIVGNLLVYRDATHLTATFARWLAPDLGGLMAS